eukprot:5452435-Amphidinium_carterae.2
MDLEDEESGSASGGARPALLTTTVDPKTSGLITTGKLMSSRKMDGAMYEPRTATEDFARFTWQSRLVRRVAKYDIDSWSTLGEEATMTRSSA